MEICMKKTIAVLGATGSVGTQALDVAEKRGFTVDFISANKSVCETEALARRHKPKAVAMANEDAARDLKLRLSDTEIKVLSGEAGIEEGIHSSAAETVINSVIGEAGLLPTLAVIDSGKRLALANKESLVIAGEVVMKRAALRGVEIIPVDSEHSAIFQSLKAGRKNEVKRLILTASGGPFFGYTKQMLKSVSLEDTLAHPTWKMGKKITVDSATLMNKGFEIIEAAHLFGVGADKIEVAVHRESILHSAVEYIDNSIIGEFSVPDMRMCVQYAIDYPERCPAVVKELDLFAVGSLSFKKPDTEAFPLLSLAKRALALGGAYPAALNAADEVAVRAFLEGKIGFTEISDTVAQTLELLPKSIADGEFGIDELISVDRDARMIAERIVKRLSE